MARRIVGTKVDLHVHRPRKCATAAFMSLLIETGGIAGIQFAYDRTG